MRSDDSLFDFIEQLFQTSEKVDFSEKVLFYELAEFCSLSEKKFNASASIFDIISLKKPKSCFFTNSDIVAKLKTEEERKSLNMKRYAVINKHKYTTVEYGNNGNNRFNGIIAKLGNGNQIYYNFYI